MYDIELIVDIYERLGSYPKGMAFALISSLAPLIGVFNSDYNDFIFYSVNNNNSIIGHYRFNVYSKYDIYIERSLKYAMIYGVDDSKEPILLHKEVNTENIKKLLDKCVLSFLVDWNLDFT